MDIGIPYPPSPEPGSLAIANNILQDNGTYGIESTIPIMAEDNWWGDASGPYHATLNPSGLGDSVSDNVDFDPWLTSPPFVPPDFVSPGDVTDLFVKPVSTQGEVELEWTAPGDDGSAGGPAAAYDIRFSNNPIDDGTWAAAYQVSGEIPPGTPGEPEEMRVSDGRLTPGTRWYFALKARDEVGNESGLSNVPSLVDSGFWPGTDGYGFCNGPSEQDCDPGWGRYPSQPAIDDFTPNDMQRMFGDEAVCWMDGSSCAAYKPWPVLWTEMVNWRMNGGHCDGMSTTSLRFFDGLDEHPDAGSTDALDLDGRVVTNWNGGSFETTVRRNIAWFHAQQFANPVTDEQQAAQQYTPTSVLGHVMSGLSSGELVTLLARKDWDTAHTIAPFAVSDLDNGLYRVWVYDSNHWGDATRYVEIDVNDDTWQYPFEPGDTWSGDTDSHSLGAVPLSLYDQQPVLPSPLLREGRATSASSNVEVWLAGRVHLLIQDEQGRRIGFVEDQFVNEIPGAYARAVLGGPSGANEPTYVLPITGTYTMLIDGQALEGPSVLTMTQFAPAQAVGLMGVVAGPGSQDVVTIEHGGTQLTYEPEADQEATLLMVTEGATESYRLEVEAADVGAGELVRLTNDTANNRLILRNAEASGGTYGLKVDRASETGEEAFYHPQLTILEMDTHIIDYGTWDGTGAITVEVDHGSDGDVDEIIGVPNLRNALYIYLPLILR